MTCTCYYNDPEPCPVCQPAAHEAWHAARELVNA